MIHIPMRTTEPLDRQTILSINQIRVEGPKTARSINTTAAAPPPPTPKPGPSPAPDIPARTAPARPVPPLINTVQKGQKIPLDPSGNPTRIEARLGWDTRDAACDVDVSAFLLDNTGKVPGDSWFVFYGQEESPDGSTTFLICQDTDREIVTVDFTRLDPAVTRIVFVLTIDQALERHLDFSMLKDAYIRIMDPSSHRELVSFRLDGYYSTVTSMMIGEIYLHKGTWKFNAIGNGVAKDLAGLCASYGVQVI